MYIFKRKFYVISNLKVIFLDPFKYFHSKISLESILEFSHPYNDLKVSRFKYEFPQMMKMVYLQPLRYSSTRKQEYLLPESYNFQLQVYDFCLG